MTTIISLRRLILKHLQSLHNLNMFLWPRKSIDSSAVITTKYFKVVENLKELMVVLILIITIIEEIIIVDGIITGSYSRNNPFNPKYNFMSLNNMNMKANTITT